MATTPARVALAVVLAVVLAACGNAEGSTSADDDPADGDVSAAAATEAHAHATAPPASGAARAAGSQLQQTLVPQPDRTGYRGAVLDMPVPKPDFTLTDTQGEPYDFRAETADAAVTFLYFGYTSCPDICPGHMAALATALREVDPDVAEQVEVVFITVDPERDGPLLREYLDSFDPSFTGLTGTPEEINRIMDRMGLHPSAIAEDGTFPPSHPVNIITFTGDASQIAYPHGANGAAIAEDLPRLVDEGVVL